MPQINAQNIQWYFKYIIVILLSWILISFVDVPRKHLFITGWSIVISKPCYILLVLIISNSNIRNQMWNDADVTTERLQFRHIIYVCHGVVRGEDLEINIIDFQCGREIRDVTTFSTKVPPFPNFSTVSGGLYWPNRRVYFIVTIVYVFWLFRHITVHRISSHLSVWWLIADKEIISFRSNRFFLTLISRPHVT